MQIEYDGLCSYRDGQGQLCRCQVQVFRDGQQAVVVACEIEENPGSSITSSYEYLADGLVDKLSLSPSHTTWIEHYPAGRYGNPNTRETFAWISFEPTDGGRLSPKWRHGSRRELEALISQSYDSGVS